MNVAEWLKTLGLEQYALLLRQNDVDADVLPSLTADDLKDLGITSVGHRRRLLDAIAGLRSTAAGAGKPALSGESPVHTTRGGERRQVTVLFADLSGYTKLTTEIDAEEIHQLLSAFFGLADAIVVEHGGTVDKHIGDCVMAVFGAPVAHGNDAERAVTAAIAIRDAMPGLAARLGRRIGVHIGVASGEVVASGTGSAHHSTYTVTGDSVNLASRLTSEAPNGEILVSAAVERTLAYRLECAPAPPLRVKGFTEPVSASRLIRLREGRREENRHFVGRKSEHEQFAAALELCIETGRGQSVYVRGEAGIGKSRLVEEFQRAARAQDFVDHTGLVLDFGAGSGRDAIRSIVRSLLGVASHTDPESAQAALQGAMNSGLIAPDRLVFLHDLLNVPQPAEMRSLYDAMDSAARARGVRDTVVQIVKAASRARPLLLLIEDLHWADDATLEHVSAIAETVAESRALLVLTSRIEGDPLTRGSRRFASLVTIDLGPLRQEEAMLLAGSRSDAATSFVARCVERAGGNPLFLEQLLHHGEQGADREVPDSVQSLVQARMDRLEPADKEALQVASIFGQRFPLVALRTLLANPAYDPSGLALHYLVRPHGGELLFSHALIRDAAYATLLRNRRRELHRKAAEWYGDRDVVLRAEHFDRAEDPAAGTAYLAAARSEAAHYRYERALALIERGLTLAGNSAERSALECCRGDLLHDMGAMGDARVAYEAALSGAQDDAERCRAWLGLGAVKRVIDDLDAAFADARRAQEAAARAGLTAEAARAHFLQGNLLFPRGDREGCLREHQASLDMARRAGSAELEAAALGGLGDGEFMRGRMLSAGDRFRECVQLCAQHGFGRIEVANLPMLAFTRWFAGETVQSLNDGLRAVERARQVGHRRAEAIAHHIVFFCRHSLGDVAGAREEADLALELARQLKAQRFEAQALAFRGEVHRLDGRRSEALADIEEAIRIARESGMGYMGAIFLGMLALAAEDSLTRARALEEGEALLAVTALSHNHLLFRRDAIEACLGCSDWGGAERHAAALEAFVTPEPLPWSSFFIARARALSACARGDASQFVELRRLSKDAERLGQKLALPAIAAPLARLA